MQTKSYEIDLIVPVYKNKTLTKSCIESIIANLHEIDTYAPRLILINDSPDDIEVSEYLRQVANSVQFSILVENQKNSGFVKSVNKGLSIAKDEKRAAILINSDTKTFKGTLSSLVKAAETDPQIGFACPRSNNASFSTMPRLPHSQGGTSITPEKNYENWFLISKYLPEVTYTPTAVGFYLFIKREVVLNFGTLNEDFEFGYEEENDLIMRANKVGFRSILANHSFAYHFGSASFLLQDLDLDEHRLKNLDKIRSIHPEFLTLVRRYELSPEFLAEVLLSNMIPTRDGKLNVVVDLQNLALNHNGSNELAVNIIKGLSESGQDRYNITLLCSAAAFEYHCLDRLPNIARTEKVSGSYAIAISFGQPFDQHRINIMEVLAPINIYGMLDVIAYDCGYLALQHDIDKYWRYVAKHSNGAFYISQFSKETCLNRFNGKFSNDHYVSLLPTMTSAYQPDGSSNQRGEKHILVLGNHFSHKDSDVTANRVARKLSTCDVVVLGAQTYSKGNLTSYRSGTLSDSHVEELFANASVVVLPSYYEGFGFGLMHALALNKPVVLRDIPASQEIISTFKSTSGIFFYEDNEDVVVNIAAAVEIGSSKVDDSEATDWKAWSLGLIEMVDRCVRSREIYSILTERIHAGNHLREFSMLKSHLSCVHSQSATATGSDAFSLATHEPQSGFTQVISRAPGEGERRVKSIDEMLELDGPEFVSAAYQTMLHRQADTEGYHHYIAKLKSGTSKLEILRNLRRSDEGRYLDLNIQGLEKLHDIPQKKGLIKFIFG